MAISSAALKSKKIGATLISNVSIQVGGRGKNFQGIALGSSINGLHSLITLSILIIILNLIHHRQYHHRHHPHQLLRAVVKKRNGLFTVRLTVSKCENFGPIFPIIKW